MHAKSAQLAAMLLRSHEHEAVHHADMRYKCMYFTDSETYI